MIVGIGHDLVHLPRFTRVFTEWSERFVARVFTLPERTYCAAFHEPARHYAARFAAKEAFYKALMRGRQLPLGFHEAWVVMAEDSLRLELGPRALELARAAGVRHTHVSLSHDGDYASAFVVLEG